MRPLLSFSLLILGRLRRTIGIRIRVYLIWGFIMISRRERPREIIVFLFFRKYFFLRMRKLYSGNMINIEIILINVLLVCPPIPLTPPHRVLVKVPRKLFKIVKNAKLNSI